MENIQSEIGMSIKMYVIEARSWNNLFIKKSNLQKKYWKNIIEIFEEYLNKLSNITVFNI